MAFILPVAAAVANAAAPALGRVTGSLIAGLQSAATNGTSISSLADLARPARVEPLVLVEKGLENLPYAEGLMKFGLTTFTGYYLQAVAMIMNVGRIDTLKVFDSLNPYRTQGSVKDAVWSMEAFEKGLPSLEAFNKPLQRGLIASLEDAAPPVGNQSGQAPKAVTPGISAEVPKQLFEADSLAVGKLINVEIKDANQSAKIPVIVRLLPSVVPSEAMTHIFTAGGRDSWGERYHLWRAGQIRFVKDLILGMDMVDAHRKALVNDPSGSLSTITDRRRNNIRKQAMSGTMSMADASNIAIISTRTARDMGRVLYGKMSSKAVRDKIFDNSYLLLLMIVDTDHERVTVYHRGLDLASDYSVKEIQGSEKNKGPDITEVFKSFHQVLGQGTNV